MEGGGGDGPDPNGGSNGGGFGSDFGGGFGSGFGSDFGGRNGSGFGGGASPGIGSGSGTSADSSAPSQSAPSQSGLPGLASSGTGLSLSGSGLGLSSGLGKGLALSDATAPGLSPSAQTVADFAGSISAPGLDVNTAGAVASAQAALANNVANAATKAAYQQKAVVNGIKSIPVLGQLVSFGETIGNAVSAFGGSAAPSVGGGSNGFNGGGPGDGGYVTDSPVLGFGGVTVNGPMRGIQPVSSGSGTSIFPDLASLFNGAGSGGSRSYGNSRYGTVPAAQRNAAAINPLIVLAGVAAALWFN